MCSDLKWISFDTVLALLDFFNSLSNSLQRYHCDLINGAKAAETRQRRIGKAIGLFKDGKKR